MKKYITIVLVTAAAAAWALPHGIAGPAVGFGGLLGDMGFIGGKADFAQAGAKTAEGLEEALAKAGEALEKTMGV
jgi:hypothetical protein